MSRGEIAWVNSPRRKQHVHRLRPLQRHREVAVGDRTVAQSDPVHRPAFRQFLPEVSDQGEIPGIVAGALLVGASVFLGQI